MKICELFTSIQGETTFQGLPFTFIRVAGCNLNCKWCDTQYARGNGKEMKIDDIINFVKRQGLKYVMVTGGEPLLQEETYILCDDLLKMGYTVLVETNGSILVDKLKKEIIKIVDVKCPSSGEHEKMKFENFKYLTEKDEIKFVIMNRKDYEYAKRIIQEFDLWGRKILFSPVHNVMSARTLAEWLLEDKLNAKLQIQLHKYLSMK